MSGIVFTAVGNPATKGSARAFIVRGRAIVTNDCKRERPWAQEVRRCADYAMVLQPWIGPVVVRVEFRMSRPKRLGKRRVNVLFDRRSDIDKCLRSILDALSGVCFLDDAQVVGIEAVQFYADFGQPPGATVAVRPISIEDEP